MNEDRIAEIAPRKGNRGVVRCDMLGPDVTRVARFGEDGLYHGHRGIAGVRRHHSLDRALQPAGHCYVAGIDSPLVLGQLTLQKEGMSWTRGAEDCAPKTHLGRVRLAILLA